MIHLYGDKTPNGLRPAIMLEETGMTYEAVRIDIERGDQFAAEFTTLNPAQCIPVLVDDEGPQERRLVLPQSGAILQYLAGKSGCFVPKDPWRLVLMQRMFMQVATDVTSASSWLFNHARGMPTKLPENVDWLQKRLARSLHEVDDWLASHDYLADEVSIADFLLYPNFAFRRPMLEADGTYPNLCRWGDRMSRRDGVQRGMRAFDAAPVGEELS